MAIDMNTIKMLKEKTGAGLMDCKKALEQAQGNIEKAIEILKEKGYEKAKKKEGREAKEGLIHIEFFDNNKKALILETNCETDFVSRTEEFKKFTKDVAQYIIQKGVKEIDEKLEEIRREAVTRFGENIGIRRWNIIEVEEDGDVLDYYVHLNKIGGLVLVNVDVEKKDDPEVKEFIHNIAIQIVSMNPKAVSEEDMDKNEIEKLKESYKNEFLSQGKPEPVAERAALGKLQKYFAQVTLLEQVYVMDDKQEEKVKDVIERFKKQKGLKNFKVKKFIRYELGGE